MTKNYQKFDLKKLLDTLCYLEKELNKKYPQAGRYFSSLDVAKILNISNETARNWLLKLRELWDLSNFLVHGYEVEFDESKKIWVHVRVQQKV